MLTRRKGERDFEELEAGERDPSETIVSQFLRDIEEDTDVGPSFYDGMKNQAVIDAVVRSAEEQRWIALHEIES